MAGWSVAKMVRGYRIVECFWPCSVRKQSCSWQHFRSHIDDETVVYIAELGSDL
jgi:hypothetical protein